MHIVYLHQYFRTPTQIGPSGTRSYEFARRLVRNGHTIDMVTSDMRAESAPRGWREMVVEGIRVHALSVPYSNYMNFYARVRAFLTFAMSSCQKAASLGGDVIFATSTPLTIAIPALYAQRRNRLPMLFEVRDVWPEAAIQLGILRNPAAIWAARRLERAAYRSATVISALSPGMRDEILRTGLVRPDQVEVIPNSCDLDAFHPDIDGAPLRQRMALQGKLVLTYLGTIGVAHGLECLLDAAKLLRGTASAGNVEFLIVGDGKAKQSLVRRAEAERLTNVRFLAPIAERSRVAELMAASDLCLTILRDIPILRTSSPNKFFDALAAGRPVLTNVRGWLQTLIDEEHCGLFATPGSPEALVERIVWADHHREQLAEMGRNARRVGETQFSRDDHARRIEALLARCVSTSAS